MLVLLVVAPARLRVTRRELPFLAVFGICGLAFVQWFYFLAIHRLAVGIALLIQYLGALLVALWARFVFHEPVRRRIWVALALALVGLAMIVDCRRRDELSTRRRRLRARRGGHLHAYILLAERGVGDRDAVSLLAWGFGFAALFLAVIAPWWSFPAGRVDDSVSLLGHLATTHAAGVGADRLDDRARDDRPVLPARRARCGTCRRRASRSSAMLEPVVATLVAWAWLDESLTRVSSPGALVVLAAIVLAQTAR